MELARIEIPQHIRKVKLSEKRRPIFFEWNGITIVAKRRLKVPRHFFKKEKEPGEYILIEDLKPNFFIGITKKDHRVIGFATTNDQLPGPKDVELSSRGNKGLKYLLYSNEGGGYKPVIANKATVGTPNMYLINGQDIYSGVISDFTLQTVMNAIKENFRPYIEKMPVITDYPIEISCELHDTIENSYVSRREGDEIGYRWDVDNYIFPYNKAFPDLLSAMKKIVDDDRLHIPGTIHTNFHPVEDHKDRKLVYIIRKTTREEILNNRKFQEYHSRVDKGFLNITKSNENTDKPTGVDNRELPDFIH